MDRKIILVAVALALISMKTAAPQVCEGLRDDEVLYAHHFEDDRFKNCTTITDNIIFGATSFLGDPWEGAHPLTVEMLEVFSTVKVITGFLSVTSYHYTFRDLSMFRNLEEINGRRLYGRQALNVHSSSLRSLGLVSLHEIRAGDVRVKYNDNLCFVTDQMWSKVLKQNRRTPEVRTPEVSVNRDPMDCIADGEVCDEQCKEIGCWGPGPDQCAECKNAQLGSTCVVDCDKFEGQFVQTEATADSPMMCDYCDPQCDGRCDGPGPSNCDKCLNVRDGPYCRPECPGLKYPSVKNKTCQPCHENCQPCHENCQEGCTGPNYNLGAKGCNSCQFLVVRLNADGIADCMAPNATECEHHEWYNRVSECSNDTLAGYSVCSQCDHQCDGCYGEGPTKCTNCRNFEMNLVCVSECGPNAFPDSDNLCQDCHEQCQKGCINGATEYDCIQCHNYEVLVEDNLSFCANECPIEYSYIQDINTCVANCSSPTCKQKNSSVSLVVIVTSISAVVICIILVVATCYWYKKHAPDQRSGLSVSYTTKWSEP